MLVIEGPVYEVILLHGVYSPVVGDVVAQGEFIGYEASIGWSTGCHTHMTVREFGKEIDFYYLID